MELMESVGRSWSEEILSGGGDRNLVGGAGRGLISQEGQWQPGRQAATAGGGRANQKACWAGL